MRVTRRHGRPLLRIEASEVALFGVLLEQLTEVLEQDERDDVTARLFPSAYPDDADAEADYRSITESGLREDRLERIGLCAADLEVGEIDLSDQDTGRRWIQVLNDLRLALGTRLGVTEEEPDIDPADPEAGDWAVYYWLTAVQDSVVVALSGR